MALKPERPGHMAGKLVDGIPLIGRRLAMSGFSLFLGYMLVVVVAVGEVSAQSSYPSGLNEAVGTRDATLSTGISGDGSVASAVRVFHAQSVTSECGEALMALLPPPE